MRKPLFKTSCTLASTLILALSVSACGSQNSSENSGTSATAAPTASGQANDAPAAKAPVKISYLTFRVGTHASAKLEEEQIKQFNAKYGKEVEVVVEEIPSDSAYEDKLKILAVSGDVPDVVMGKNGINDILIKGNLVTPFNDYLDKDPEWKAEVGEAALAANTRDGKVWSISDQKQNIGYFYNKEMFEKAGIQPAQTWDEFMSNNEKLKAAGFVPLALMTGENAWTTNLILAALVGTNGEAGNTFMNTLHPTDFNTPEMIQALNMMKTMLEKYTTKDALGAGYANAANAFSQNKAAMIANGPWMIGDFSDPTKSSADFDKKVGVAAYPDNSLISTYEVGYMIGAKTPETRDAAEKFIRFKTGIEGQTIALEYGNVMPVSNKIQPSDALKQKYPLFVESIKLAQQTQVHYQSFDSIVYPNITDAWKSLYPKLVFGQSTAEEIAKELTEIAAKHK
ncbi:extracellular solute-binding protein [Paenibacillus sonchi]|uniref:Extracellular solute-binding protein n=1 Tax=Paenibacillus sonchi TaxID=373687 RepID=A0A974PEB8_9BACL|nr:extracellular solute-binding protein [Paenibacillus sonchi]QQZ61898.1 extracellular solute-binding protein [Paenibacillus sonchi]